MDLIKYFRRTNTKVEHGYQEAQSTSASALMEEGRCPAGGEGTTGLWLALRAARALGQVGPALCAPPLSLAPCLSATRSGLGAEAWGAIASGTRRRRHGGRPRRCCGGRCAGAGPIPGPDLPAHCGAGARHAAPAPGLLSPRDADRVQPVQAGLAPTARPRGQGVPAGRG